DIAWIISHNEVLFSHILPEIQASFKDLKQFLRIIKNGLKTENRKQFLSMSRFFRHQQKNLRYIVICAEK
ncbi:hypothetical protein EFP30_17660, partial [Lactiplantibacillus pentosus]|nr:hypothetical protein [Lactiplantibacillus pentosus]